jgi:tetratricopeptide (TPR) repeat protein
VETAAARYLGKMSGPIIQMLDKMWLKKHAGSSDRSKKKAKTDNPENTPSNQQRLAALKKQLAEGKENEDLLWKVANLSEEVEGKAAAIEVYKRLLKLNPGHAKTIFAVGRILLSQDDSAGVDVLEKAVKLDAGCQAQAYWLLANYFKKTGQQDKAKEYLEKAAGVSTSSAA